MIDSDVNVCYDLELSHQNGRSTHRRTVGEIGSSTDAPREMARYGIGDAMERSRGAAAVLSQWIRVRGADGTIRTSWTDQRADPGWCQRPSRRRQLHPPDRRGAWW